MTVSCTPDVAFELWTARRALWWPLTTHSFSREDAVDVVVERFVGGRIYERTRDGRELDWGMITAFEPPERFAHTWYLGFTPDHATDVDVRFEEEGTGTRVTVTQTGFERLGGEAQGRRDGNERGWATMLSRFVDAVTEGNAGSG